MWDNSYIVFHIFNPVGIALTAFLNIFAQFKGSSNNRSIDSYWATDSGRCYSFIWVYDLKV